MSAEVSDREVLRACVEVNIGKLDRCLSELKLHALNPLLDEADIQTIKHHAEDCVGLGNRVLEILKAREGK